MSVVIKSSPDGNVEAVREALDLAMAGGVSHV